jgi:hypothetical protein
VAGADIVVGELGFETGKSGNFRAKLRQSIKDCGFIITSEEIAQDDPSHLIFVCSKTGLVELSMSRLQEDQQLHW